MENNGEDTTNLQPNDGHPLDPYRPPSGRAKGSPVSPPIRSTLADDHTKPSRKASPTAPSHRRNHSSTGLNIGSTDGNSLPTRRSSTRASKKEHGSPSSSTSIGVVLGVRRRPRVSLKQVSHGVSFNSDDPDEEKKNEEPIQSGTPCRRESLKNVAKFIRGNVRNSATLSPPKPDTTNTPSGAAESTESGDTDTPPAFADVAHQVVTTQRAAKGFIAMWARENTGGVHVYKGIHMEKKKLDLVTVVSEYKEIKRRQFYQELVVYLVFLATFFSILAWLPVQESYQQNDVVGYSTCREEGVCELKKVPDVYEFANNLVDRLCRRKDVNDQWIRMGGVRFRQVRVKETKCLVHGDWYIPCYPFYSSEVEQHDPIPSKTGSNYTWYDRLGPLEPLLYTSMFGPFSQVESYGNGGYAVDLCHVEVDQLQEDDWLSVSTRAFSVEFVLMNPVTRIFTVGSHVFTLNPSGHMKHFPHSANLRVIGLEMNAIVQDHPVGHHSGNTVSLTNPNDWLGRLSREFDLPILKEILHPIKWWLLESYDIRILLWVLLVLFFLTYCIGEASEMSTMGVGTYLKADMWNLFEMAHLSILFALLYYMYSYYMNSLTFGQVMGEMVYHPTHQDTSKTTATLDTTVIQDLLIAFQQLSDFASLASAISLLKVFKFLRMNSTLNLLWQVLGMALRDLMGFLVIFNLIFLGYSTMGSYAFGFALEEFSTISRSYGTCFHMLAGEMDYPRLRQANPRLAPIFIVTFIVLVFQILVNMFVAILSEYYEFAKNASEENKKNNEELEYDVLARFRNYLSSCSPTVVVKKNELLRLFPGQEVRLISSNLIDQEEMRQRARKLFRGAVWRVVALLRFGMKFDRRIQFGDRHIAAKKSQKYQDDKNAIKHIRLSENFDHKTIKEMIPTGITVRLQGDSLLGNGVVLKVVRHNKLSVECVVLSHESIEQQTTRIQYIDENQQPEQRSESEKQSPSPPPSIKALELLGGETLRIPWRLFVVHVVRTLWKEMRMGAMRATKLWNFFQKEHLVDDYHLWLLFEDLRKDGRESLRYDQIYRMLDLYLRKEKGRKSLCTQQEVREETLQVMYRFRKCLIDMPSREKEGHNYTPNPVDTSTIELGPLEHLADMLAQNCHDMWALERLKQGWKFGKERDDMNKYHPNLIPYELLTKEEQAFDYRSSVETLKSILFMNYSIARVSPTSLASISGKTSSGAILSRASSSSAYSDQENAPGSGSPRVSMDLLSENTPTGASSLRREAWHFRRQSLMDDSPYFTLYNDPISGEEDLLYRPLPIDTSRVELPLRLLRLVDLLAENAHEVWSRGRMDEGWTYGPQRDDKAKNHPCLVPYVFLTEEEKEYDLNIAKETLKTLLAMKFTVSDHSSK